jgi:hypothetical protein
MRLQSATADTCKASFQLAARGCFFDTPPSSAQKDGGSHLPLKTDKGRKKETTTADAQSD